MSLRVLSLVYPLTPLTEHACGGAEQVAWHLLRRLGRTPGLEVTYVAAEGSAAAPGARCITWQALGLSPLASHHVWSPLELARLQQQCQRAVWAWLAGHPVDLVHDHGAWFWPEAAATPVLLTLHLARRLYPDHLFQRRRPQLHFNLVSRCQAGQYPDLPALPVIANGIDLASYPPRRCRPRPDAPLLYLGRICPEKAPHLAIALARRLGRRLHLVGAVSPFPDHQRYYRHSIEPHLGAGVRWWAPPRLEAKRRLLQSAAAVVIPSQIEETSSLVAMEAAASGVPVLALARGALPDIVADGQTGWLAQDVDGLVAAAAQLEAIAPDCCRARAEACFDADRMAAGYAALYRSVALAQREKKS